MTCWKPRYNGHINYLIMVNKWLLMVNILCLMALIVMNGVHDS